MLAFLLSVGKNLHLAVEDVSLLERKIDVSSGASLEGVKSGISRAISIFCCTHFYNWKWPYELYTTVNQMVFFREPLFLFL